LSGQVSLVVDVQYFVHRSFNVSSVKTCDVELTVIMTLFQSIEQKATQKNKDFSSDVHEGKTIFLRNLSFDVQEEELEEKMNTFGETKYCKVIEFVWLEVIVLSSCVFQKLFQISDFNYRFVFVCGKKDVLA